MKKDTYGKFHLYLQDGAVEPSVLIDAFLKADVLEGKGRDSIKVLTVGGKRIACRKYIHGGLLRGFTKDYFFSGKRAIKELEIIYYLKKVGFPVVEPYCAIIETCGAMKIPYLLTVFEEDAISLLDFFSKAEPGTRSKIIKTLAGHMYDLERVGAYHPDLHLNNVLITHNNDMKFLDFDKARIGPITKKDMVRMFWRLNRYVEKMAKSGYGNVSVKEKILFLKSYKRLSGYDVLPLMKKRLKTMRFFDKTGWFLDSFLYRSKDK
ncbi:MAG: hypothetical protein NTX75_11960 [Proteobacteria bacterium]|nr:hypothetical protein [Pseudomonadota bacterium]